MMLKTPRRWSTEIVQKRKTVADILSQHRRGEKITMVTSSEYSLAGIVDGSDAVDIILVGDSLGMVTLGHETTLPVTLDDMVHHTRAVSRGAKRALVVGDLPFGSYEVSRESAMRSALRLVKEGGADAVKLEGGRTPQVRSIVECGIPVCGHLGLTPQAMNVLGGFRVQGRTARAAEALVRDACELEAAGCFAVVLESVPDRLADFITKKLTIPTIGIGAGKDTSGQVLVLHDMMRLFKRQPKFCKVYRDLGSEMTAALREFKRDVGAKLFPGPEHSFTIADAEWEQFLRMQQGKAASAPVSKRSPVQDTLPTLHDGPAVQQQSHHAKDAAGSQQQSFPEVWKFPESPRVAVFGGGAMGSLIAASVAQGNKASEVWLVSGWREHADAVNESGIAVEDAAGRVSRVSGIRAAVDLSTVPAVDLAIVAVKSPMTREAATKIKTCLKPGGTVLTLQNGLGNIETLTEVLLQPTGPAMKIISGTTSHGAMVAAPGRLKHTGTGQTLIAAARGSLDISTKISQLLGGPGSIMGRCDVVRDAEGLVWAKLIVNSAINPIGALTGLTNGGILASPGSRSLIHAIVSEGVAVATAKGVNLPVRDAEASVVSVLINTGPNKSSMLQDVIRGVPTEVRAINGAIAREGQRLGIVTPINTAITEALSSQGVIKELPNLQKLFVEFLRH